MRVIALSLCIMSASYAGHGFTIDNYATTGSVYLVNDSNWRVQLGSYPERAQAEKAVQNFKDKDFSPFAIVNAGGAYKVVFGHFDNYVDALIYKNAFHDTDIDGFIVSVPKDTGNGSIRETAIAGPLASSFNLEPGELSARSTETLSNRSEYKALEALDTPGNGAAYKEQLLKAKEACARR